MPGVGHYFEVTIEFSLLIIDSLERLNRLRIRVTISNGVKSGRMDVNGLNDVLRMNVENVLSFALCSLIASEISYSSRFFRSLFMFCLERDTFEI